MLLFKHCSSIGLRFFKHRLLSFDFQFTFMENNNMTLHYFLPKITSSGVVSGLWFFLAFQGNVICQCHRSSNGVVYHFSVTCIYWIQPKMLLGRTRKNKKVKWICCNNFWRCVSSYLVLSHLRFTSSHHNSHCIQNLHFSKKQAISVLNIDHDSWSQLR